MHVVGDAVAAIRERMPDLLDAKSVPCSLAVKAYVDLHGEGGRVTPSMVRARRAALMAGLPAYAASWEAWELERQAQGVQLQLEVSA